MCEGAVPAGGIVTPTIYEVFNAWDNRASIRNKCNTIFTIMFSVQYLKIRISVFTSPYVETFISTEGAGRLQQTLPLCFYANPQQTKHWL